MMRNLKNVEGLHRLYGTTSLLNLILVFFLASLSFVTLANNPPGSNGTIKIQGQDIDSIPDNDPHPGCEFDVEWYNFDEGPNLTSQVNFTAIAPTAGGTLELGGIFIGEDPADGSLDARHSFDIQSIFAGVEAHPNQGYHTKLEILATDGTRKSKVFWVECPVQPPQCANPPLPQLSLHFSTPDLGGVASLGETFQVELVVTNNGQVDVSEFSMGYYVDSAFLSFVANAPPSGGWHYPWAANQKNLKPGESVSQTVTLQALRDTSGNIGGFAESLFHVDNVMVDPDGFGGQDPCNIDISYQSLLIPITILGPTSVNFSSMGVKPKDDQGYLVYFETVNESNTAGFYIYRLSVDGKKVLVSDSLLPAQYPGQPQGGYYEVFDRVEMNSPASYEIQHLNFLGIIDDIQTIIVPNSTAQKPTEDELLIEHPIGSDAYGDPGPFGAADKKLAEKKEPAKGEANSKEPVFFQENSSNLGEISYCLYQMTTAGDFGHPEQLKITGFAYSPDSHYNRKAIRCHSLKEMATHVKFDGLTPGYTYTVQIGMRGPIGPLVYIPDDGQRHEVIFKFGPGGEMWAEPLSLYSKSWWLNVRSGFEKINVPDREVSRCLAKLPPIISKDNRKNSWWNVDQDPRTGFGINVVEAIENIINRDGAFRAMKWAASTPIFDYSRWSDIMKKNCLNP